MKKSLLILLLLAVIFSSCSLMNCDKEEELFTNQYHTYQVELNNDIKVDSLLNLLINRYCVDAVNNELPFLVFDLKEQKFVSEENNSTLKIGIEPPLCFEAEYDLDKILEIVKEHNNYRVEEEIVVVDSISSLVFNHYVNKDEGDYLNSVDIKGIWIITENTESINDAAIVIPQIIDGYRKVADFISNEYYGKTYCELNENQLNLINQKLVFRLSYKHYTPEVELNFESPAF